MDASLSIAVHSTVQENCDPSVYEFIKSQKWPITEFIAESPFAFVLYGKSNKLHLMYPGLVGGENFTLDLSAKQNIYSLTHIKGEQLLKKAVGKASLTIFDMTGGFAGDALMLSSLGYKVVSQEKHPLIYVLTQNELVNLKQYAIENSLTKIEQVVSRVEYKCGDSSAIENGTYDVAYIDPMFPEKRKSSLPPKPMQVLQKLVGKDQSVENLLDAAISSKITRIVIKRPAKSEKIRPRLLKASFEGKSIRYDMYAF